MVSANCNIAHRNGHLAPTRGGPSAASAITLAHLSDPHISCMAAITARELLSKRLFGYLSWKLRRGAKHDDSVLQALQTDLKKTKPGHIAVTGDLTHLGLSAEFKKTSRWLQSLGTPQEITVIPGNHDRYVKTIRLKSMAGLTDYMLSDAPRQGDGSTEDIDSIFPSLRIRGSVAIIGVCTARPTAPHLAAGSIGTVQLQNLQNLLAYTAGQKYFRVMLIHHSPVPGALSWRKRLTDGADLTSLLARYGTELILHGHAHRTHQSCLQTSTGSIPVMGAPSISALDRTGERRAGYYIYQISSDGCAWKVGLEVRRYAPEKNRFITERSQQLSCPLSPGVPAGD